MPSNIVTDVLTSQGNSPVTGATKYSVKVTRNASASSKLDASTLSLSHGANRVYENGLTDNGPSGSTTGTTVTATIEGLGTAPAKGSTLTLEGVSVKCVDVTSDNNVGELKSWSASYTSDFPADPA